MLFAKGFYFKYNVHTKHDKFKIQLKDTDENSKDRL